MQSNNAPPLSQEERWERLISGLSEQQMRALFRLAYSILQNKEDAKDALQEALITGATNYNKLRDPDKLFSWMYAIVRRQASAYHRKFSVKSFLTQTRIAFTLSDNVKSVEDLILEEHKKEELAQAVEKLRSPSKEILLMRIVDDMDFVQIAKLLGMNYHTVRSRYSRTLKDLRKSLEDDDHG